MKRVFALLFYCFTSGTLYSQFVAQSAEGKGGVILPLNGAAIGFDIGKSEISIGLNNYNKALGKDNKCLFRNWFFGGNLSVKNSTGIGNLFQSGNIVPAGNMLGILGFNLNNNEAIRKEWKKSELNNIRQKEQELRRALIVEYKADILKYFDNASELITDKTFRESTRDNFQKSINGGDGYAVGLAVKMLIESKDDRLKDFILYFSDLLLPRRKKYFEDLVKLDATKQIDTAFGKFMMKNPVKRVTPFLLGGIEARNFTLYNGLNVVSLPKSFTDTLYRGGQFGVGINAQYGSFWGGVTYTYVKGDNFANLTNKEYTLRTADTSRNQTLISEKKITGYSGKYSKVEYNLLNIDLIKEFQLNDTSRLITNLYYRGLLHSRDTAFLKNYSSIGIGFYFLGKKSKFLGGLYIELPDINNNIEKAKPEAERSIRAPFKKLTFGIVTKFSLDSILGFNDRPRKPD